MERLGTLDLVVEAEAEAEAEAVAERVQLLVELVELVVTAEPDQMAL
jgi:hypothetical protein